MAGMVRALFETFCLSPHGAEMQDALSSQNLQVRELREAKMRQEELKREAQEQRGEWYNLYIHASTCLFDTAALG